MRENLPEKLRVILVAVLCTAGAVFLFLPGASATADTFTFSEPVKGDIPQAEPDGECVPEFGTGYIRPSMDLSHITGTFPVRSDSRRMLTADSLPSSFDWREQGKVTSVKDQGSCGSCYAFASLGQIESWFLINGGTEYDFSENYAKDCNYYEEHEGERGIVGTSCDGGNYPIVANLYAKKGIVQESCDPYIAVDVACGFDPENCPPVVTMLEWNMLGGNSVPDTDFLKSCIMEYGPVYAAIYACFDITYDGTYVIYHHGTESPNHAVLITGWDDTMEHAGGTGAWIVKNSWGTDWGDDGYFYMAYGSAKLGVDAAVATGFCEYDENGDVLYYDEGGYWNAIGAGSTTAWGLAKYTVDTDTVVTRVEFWTADATTDIDIKLYGGFDGTSFGEQLGQQTNLSFPYAGYHSVELDTPLLLNAGDTIVPEVKFTNLTSQWPLAYDEYGTKEAGKTYASGDGSQWFDSTDILLYENHFCGNLGIRLRTTTAETVADFEVDTVIGGAPLTVQFTDNSVGMIDSWLWNFGDGATSDEQNPTHEYTVAQSYTVSLTVTGFSGNDTETKTDYITVEPGTLATLEIDPEFTALSAGEQSQFSASAWDAYDNAISGLDYDWSVVNGGGTIGVDGLFTAGVDAGTFTDTVQVEAQDGEVTLQAYATAVVGTSITVQVVLPGQLGRTTMDIPVTCTLYTTSDEITSGTLGEITPVRTVSTGTGEITCTGSNPATNTGTYQIEGLPAGTYQVLFEGFNTLGNLKQDVTVSEGALVDMGTLVGGNASGDHIISGADFSMMLNDYWQQSGDASWNSGRCDFDGDGQVTSLDYSILATNYNMTTPQSAS